MKEMNIPEFLKEISHQLKEQDNRCTQDPIFMVCYDKWLTCADGRGDKEVFLINRDDEYTECDTKEELANYLIEHYEDFVNEYLLQQEDPNDLDLFREEFNPEDEIYPVGLNVELMCMQKEMTVVNSHLTEAGAKQFIKRKQHSYQKLYIYAYSMNLCPQMIELRKWIIGLTD